MMTVLIVLQLLQLLELLDAPNDATRREDTSRDASVAPQHW